MGLMRKENLDGAEYGVNPDLSLSLSFWGWTLDSYMMTFIMNWALESDRQRFEFSLGEFLAA